MTKKEAETEFKSRHRRTINLEELNQADGTWPVRKNTTLRCNLWTEFTDALYKDGRITRQQLGKWNPPAWCN